jgi:hypothetical protein
MNKLKFLGSIVFKLVNLIPLSIILAKVLETQLRNNGIEFISSSDSFISDYIQWAGVLYGVTTPLVLLKVVEQLESLDQEFDKESEKVKLFFECIYYSPKKDSRHIKEISDLLRRYVAHVILNYRNEVRRRNLKAMEIDFVTSGDQILDDMSRAIRYLTHSKIMKSKDSKLLILELLQMLGEIRDIRGNRIALASKGMFESLLLVLALTSCAFIVPLYFIGFTPTTPLGNNVLITLGTLLVIFIFMVIEDLSDPYGNMWSARSTSWRRILEYLDSAENKDELKNHAKKD